MNGQRATVVFLSIMYGMTLAAAARNPSQFGSGGVYKALWGIGALGLALSAVAEFAPQVAGPLAFSIMLAAAVKYRGALGSIVSGSGGRPGIDLSKPIQGGGSDLPGTIPGKPRTLIGPGGSLETPA